MPYDFHAVWRIEIEDRAAPDGIRHEDVALPVGPFGSRELAEEAQRNYRAHLTTKTGWASVGTDHDLTPIRRYGEREVA